MTKGLISQVYKLSDQKTPINQKFQYIVPLLHSIAKILGDTEYSKINLTIYNTLISNNRGEFNIWEGNSNFEGLPENLIYAITNIRTGNYLYMPGYEVNYGKLRFNSMN